MLPLSRFVWVSCCLCWASCEPNSHPKVPPPATPLPTKHTHTHSHACPHDRTHTHKSPRHTQIHVSWPPLGYIFTVLSSGVCSMMLLKECLSANLWSRRLIISISLLQMSEPSYQQWLREDKQINHKCHRACVHKLISEPWRLLRFLKSDRLYCFFMAKAQQVATQQGLMHRMNMVHL